MRQREMIQREKMEVFTCHAFKLLVDEMGSPITPQRCLCYAGGDCIYGKGGKCDALRLRVTFYFEV